jgi:hypothetical protein
MELYIALNDNICHKNYLNRITDMSFIIIGLFTAHKFR